MRRLDIFCRVLVMLAQPLLAWRDNPFLTLELRRLARCPASGEYGVYFMLSAMVLPWLQPLQDRLSGGTGTPLGAPQFLIASAAVHFLGCLGALMWSSPRVFDKEYEAGMLAEVLSIPLPAREWLALKLVAPLYVLVVVWAVGAPLHAVVALLSWVPPLDALLAALAPLLCSLCLWGWGALLTPDLRSRRDLEKGAASSMRRPGASPTAPPGNVIGLLILFFAVAGGVALFVFEAGIGGAFRSAPFYGTAAPRVMSLAVGFIGLLLAGFLTAEAAVNGSADYAEEVADQRRIILATVYYCALGFLWRSVPLPAAFSLVAIPPAGWLITRARKANAAAQRAASAAPISRWRRWQNRLAAREIAWTESHFDNAVLVHDLRILLATKSLRWRMVCDWLRGAIYLVLIIKLFLLYKLVIVIIPAVLIALTALMRINFNASGEITRKTMRGSSFYALLATPLPSRDIMIGRTLAALITGLVPNLGYLFCNMVGLCTISGWPVWDAIIHLLPLLPMTTIMATASGCLAPLMEGFNRIASRLTIAQGCLVMLNFMATIGWCLFFAPRHDINSHTYQWLWLAFAGAEITFACVWYSMLLTLWKRLRCGGLDTLIPKSV